MFISSRMSYSTLRIQADSSSLFWIVHSNVYLAKHNCLTMQSIMGDLFFLRKKKFNFEKDQSFSSLFHNTNLSIAFDRIVLWQSSRKFEYCRNQNVTWFIHNYRNKIYHSQCYYFFVVTELDGIKQNDNGKHLYIKTLILWKALNS